MRKYLALLLFVSCQAHASSSPCPFGAASLTADVNAPFGIVSMPAGSPFTFTVKADAFNASSINCGGFIPPPTVLFTVTGIETSLGTLTLGDGRSIALSVTSLHPVFDVPVVYGIGSFTAQASGEFLLDFDSRFADGTFIEHGVYSIPWSSISISVISHAPEPETYAMMLAGLGLIGGMKRWMSTTRNT